MYEPSPPLTEGGGIQANKKMEVQMKTPIKHPEPPCPKCPYTLGVQKVVTVTATYPCKAKDMWDEWDGHEHILDAGHFKVVRFAAVLAVA